MKYFKTYLAIAFVLLASVGEVYAQSESGEKAITNQATVVYDDPFGPGQISVFSNLVKVLMGEGAGLSLGPSNSISSYRGNDVELTQAITNNGTAKATLDITINNMGDDDFDLENMQWVNQKKATLPRAKTSLRKSSAKSDNTLKTTVSVQPGETFNFSYGGKISSSIEGQIQALLDIKAVPREFNAVYQNIDTVNVLVGTKLSLEKNQIGAKDLKPGDSFTYHLKGQNIGDVNAPGRTIKIDGKEKDKVVLTDAIPANVTFTGFTKVDKGTKLYHTPENGKFELTAKAPADLSKVDIIGIAYDSLVVGERVEASFDVIINENAGGELKNTAEFSYVNPEGSVTTTTASNQVIAGLPENKAELSFYTDDTFEHKTGTSSVGNPLFLESSAGQCNESSGIIDQVSLTINSKKTGDEEVVLAKETDFNTGIFRVENAIPTRDGNTHKVVKGNDILETVEKDRLEATLNCNGMQNNNGPSQSVTANVVVDPKGIVFDSETNDPISGVKVSILDAATGELVDVYEMDGTTKSENPHTSESDGTFRFSFVETGSYRMVVEPPKGYTFSSEVPAKLLPADRDIDAKGSYGKTFTFNNAPSGVDFDIPLDPKREGVLFMDKAADRKEVELGEFVTYTLKIRSEAVNTVNNISILDELPFGFEYLPGSAKLDGQKIADPEGGKGPALTFDIGDLNTGQTKEVTYSLLAGPGAKRSDGINTAIAKSDEIIARTSNQAKVKIEVRGGVFSDDGFIIGKVFADCNQNGVQDPGESGMPGVRLYLENGNYVITDSQGLYTFYGLQPNMHVLKLDNHSLPEGSRLVELDNRHAGDPSSRFVDLKKGQMHRTEFAVCNCSEAFNQEIQNRRNAFSSLSGDGLSKSVKKNLSVNERTNSQRRHDEASGVVGGAKAPETAKQKTPQEKDSAKSSPDKREKSSRESIEKALLKAGGGLGFMNIADGDTVSAQQITLWAKSRKDANLKLTINGTEVGKNKIGQRSVSAAKSLQLWEYVSVQLEPGKNVLKLEEVDPFGNVRQSQEISVVAPGELAKLSVTVPRNDVNADGQSAALLRVELTDKEGVRVGSKIPITLDNSLGKWEIEDEDNRKPGTQTFVENGSRSFELTSTIEPNTAIVKAYAGTLEDRAEVTFLPDLRPLIAAGIIQGTVRLSDPLNIRPSTSADGFERELTSLSYSMNNFTADARLAFFLKGKIRGDMLLTASYDSEKDEEDRLFRDIRPDEFYPVYGESSIKGFDAQSSTRLYVRVDKKKTYALYGDFITQERHPDRLLGDYSRAQTGAKAHYEKGRIQANAYGASSVSRQRIREIQGQGISRYELPDDNIIENSEIIEVVTVDRNQPDLITDVERLTRFKDYVLEPFSGVITFKSPVSSVDEDFNPIFIRATYEVESDDKRYMVGGANGSVDFTDDITLGANVVRDDNPDDQFTMVSGNVSVRLGKNTKAVGEVAHTRSELDGNGTAERIKIQHQGSKADLTAQVAKSDKDFENPSSTLAQGRIEAKARGRYNLSSKTNVNGEFLLSRNDTTGAQTIGGMVNVQQTFAQNFNAELGVRHSQQTGLQDVTNTNVRGRVTADLPFLKGASANAEYEQDLRDIDRKIIGIGADYKIDWGKIYANHEFISSTQGAYTLSSSQKRHNTAVGIDANYMKNGRVYSEYRLDNGIDGQSGQAAIGVRNRFVLSEGFGINAGFERTFTIQGLPTNDGTSITTSVDYTASPNWKGTARLEGRFTRNSNTYFGSWGYGQKISKDWTFLGKNVVALNTTDGVSGFSKVQERLRLGTAYRDITTDKFDALFRYELKYEEDAAIADDHYRMAHVFSTHANYKPHRDWTVSGRLAAKKMMEYRDKLRAESFLELASTRLMYEITERLDASVNSSILMDADFSTKDYGLGIEAGYVVAKNLRVAAGFNFFGYNDEDLAANNYTRKGVYAGFSYKFDEQILRSLMPKRSDKIIDESVYQECLPCQTQPEPIEYITPEYKVPDPVFKARDIETNFVYELREKRKLLPQHIHFANNKTYINQPAAKMLDIVAKYLLKNGGDSYSIDITGHTDSKSSYGYNLVLSRRRAKAVRAYLVAAGVDPDKLQFKGLSFNSESRKESDRVDMALNRRVELNLSVDDENVRIIPQVEDLQVNEKVPGISEWDYIFVSRIDAVPSQLHITSDTLNTVQKFIAQRIGLTMSEYYDVTLSMTTTDTLFANKVRDILYRADIDSSRISINDSGRDDIVGMNFTNKDKLAVYDQQDDLQLPQSDIAQSMMDNLLNILRSRKDYLLIRELIVNENVPQTLEFNHRSSALSSVSEAVLSRIGSYLKHSQEMALTITGNSSALSHKRVQTTVDYLVAWGISQNRIETNVGQAAEGSIQFKYVEEKSKVDE